MHCKTREKCPFSAISRFSGYFNLWRLSPKISLKRFLGYWTHFPTVRKTPWGGGERRGVENLTNDTPPPKGFWTPPRTVRFPSPSVLCFSCTRIHDRADQKLFWRGPKIFGRRVLWYVFLPPYVLHPPISRPKL